MSLLRFPQGHGPVTVSLLMPLLTLASSLAFRPVFAPATAGSPAPAAPAVAVEPAASGPAATCEPNAPHVCDSESDAARTIVLVRKADAVPVDAAPAATPAAPAFGFELAQAVAAPLAAGIRTAAFSYNGDDDMPIVLMDPSKGESVGFWHSDGSAALRRLQKTEKSRSLWFRSDGRDYVIRDAALLDRAEEIVEPQSRLGRAQGEVGGVQGGIGGQQGRLGARQGALGRRLGELARREASLRSSLHRRSLGASEERAIEAELDEIAERRERVQAEMSSLAEGQAKLAARQARLGERQAEMGRRQAEMSRQVTRDLKELVREALRTGKAVRLGTEVY